MELERDKAREKEKGREKGKTSLGSEMTQEIIRYLIDADEPWTRYRTRIDLLGMAEDAPEVKEDRAAMLEHPLVKELISKSTTWPGYPLKRHNDAKHPLHTMAVLADFGLKTSDPGMNEVIEKVLSHQSPEGAFETKVQLYKQFGGLEGEYWTWMSCDMPLLLYVLSSFGLEDGKPLEEAKALLLSLAEENGWRCKSSPTLGTFKGPGKKEDPCPIANVYALRALSLDPERREDPRVKNGIEMLLHHWEIQGEKKYFLFGIGTDFRKLKYPLIWYDILHFADVLSMFPTAIADPRYKDMLHVLADQLRGRQDELLLRVLLAQAVEDAHLGADNELFGCALPGILVHTAGRADVVGDFEDGGGVKRPALMRLK